MKDLEKNWDLLIARLEKQFDYDVQKRVPDVRKAKELLDFTATTKLEPVVDNLIDWIKNNYQINQ